MTKGSPPQKLSVRGVPHVVRRTMLSGYFSFGKTVWQTSHVSWSGIASLHVQKPCGWTGFFWSRHAGHGVNFESPGVVAGIIAARYSGVSLPVAERAVRS